MSESKIYYIYIDTRIHGAIDQLVSYFQANVFNVDNCIYVLCKYYKDIAPYIKKKFEQENIPLRFIKTNRDLVLIENRTVLYLFNAQSNCRLVANRELTHIFVTHGESHKSASVKPILRIYDFVITSGQIGVERLLKAGIFSIDDVINGQKVLIFGDTFIGKNQFSYVASSQSLLYAPTWEGGIPSENYSSLANDPASRIIQIALEKNIKKIFIQPHPNLGHRDPQYLILLKGLINKLKKAGFKVVILKSAISLLDYIHFPNVRKIDLGCVEKISFAITDISAMEMQFIHEKIPTYVLTDVDQISQLIIPRKVQHLYCNDLNLSVDERDTFFKANYDYFFGYIDASLSKMTHKDRLIWLCRYTTALKQKKREEIFDQF